MKIYAVADVHGKPERMVRIENTIAAAAPDALVIAGDITHFVRAGRTLARLGRLSVPVLAVCGNTDRRHVERWLERLPSITPLHQNRAVVGRTPFVGLSGTALLPLRSRIGFRERRLFDRIAPLMDRNTVLVVHPPPWGVRDEVLGRFHSGSRGLLEALHRFQPALLLFGHIHERAGASVVGSTLCVNCAMGRGGGGALIRMEGGRATGVEMI